MPKRTLQGTVVSNKGDKTVIVQVERRLMHPVYKKFITTSKKYAAHDEENRSQEGEQVKIRECQPVSKRKFFEVVYDEEAQAQIRKQYHDTDAVKFRSGR